MDGLYTNKRGKRTESKYLYCYNCDKIFVVRLEEIDAVLEVVPA